MCVCLYFAMLWTSSSVSFHPLIELNRKIYVRGITEVFLKRLPKDVTLLMVKQGGDID